MIYYVNEDASYDDIQMIANYLTVFSLNVNPCPSDKDLRWKIKFYTNQFFPETEMLLPNVSFV